MRWATACWRALEAAKLDFSDDALDKVRKLGMNKVMNEPGGTAYAQRIPIPGLEWRWQQNPAPAPGCAFIRRKSICAAWPRMPPWKWKLRRTMACSSASAPVSDPKYAIACVVEHGSDGHPQIVAARDVMEFALQRDPLKLPAAYPPVNSANAAPVRQQASAAPAQKLAKAGD